MKRLPQLLLLLILGAATLMTLSRSHEAPGMSEKALKARYYFLQGTVAEASGDAASAYEYYKKANSIDPSYPEAAYSYGLMRLGIDHDTLATREEKRAGLLLARPLVDLYPGDFYPAMNYAYMAGMFDSVAEPIRVFERLQRLRPEKTVSLLYLSQFYAMQKETSKAVDALDRYERIEGHSIPLTLRKVVYHLSDADTLAAIAEAEKLIAMNPAEADYIMLKGNVFEYLAMPDSALAYYERAERAAPESGRVKQQLAKFFASQGDSVNYDLKTYQSLLCEDLDLQDKLEQMAAYLQKIINDKSDTQRGDTLFNVLRSQYPHESEILYLSARYNGAKRNYPAAIEDIGYAIDLDGDNENLWQSLLLFQLSDDRPREAMQSYRKMQTKITDPSLPVKLLFANAAQLSDSTATAVGTYQELLYSIDKSLTLADTITNKNDYRHFGIDQAGLVSELYEMAGDAYFAAEPKMMEDSYRCYENALFFNPDNLLALNNYAYFIVDTENPATDSPRFEKAKNMSRRTVESTTSNPNGTYLDTYAWILFKEGNYKEALQYQKAAIEAAEEEGNPSAELYFHYGDILFMSGAPDEALEYWEKALGMESDNELLQRKVKNKTFYWK